MQTSWNRYASELPCSRVSLDAPPLPSTPSLEVLPRDLVSTVHFLSQDLKIVTPIMVDILESHLVKHPNRDLVRSVCRGFREGFWPLAGTPHHYLVNESRKQRKYIPKDEEAFMETLFIKERAAERFSQSIGKQLLPGMACMPVHVIWQENSNKFRPIYDHSAGDSSINGLIPKHLRAVHMDSVYQLIHAIHKKKIEFKDIVLFKSDVSDAYRNLPMSPYWQVLQAIRIKDQFYIDRCNTFGNAGSQTIFCAFFSLVLWIAENRGIEDIFSYIDDNFSWEFKEKMSIYEGRYRQELPDKQVRLLRLWDELGIPHASKKQEFGSILTVIGYEIDLIRERISVGTNSMRKSLDKLSTIIDANQGETRTLKECTKFVGTINRAIGLIPFMLPGILPLYDEMNKVNQNDLQSPVFISEDVRTHLKWLGKMMRTSKGISISRSRMWDYANQDPLFIYIDTRTVGFVIWMPQPDEALRFSFDDFKQISEASLPILWLLAINHAISDARLSFHPVTKKVLSCSGRIQFFVDSPEAVDLFENLKPSGELKKLFMSIMEAVIEGDIDIRVSQRNKEDKALETLLNHLHTESQDAFDELYPETILKNVRIPQHVKKFLPETIEALDDDSSSIRSRISSRLSLAENCRVKERELVDGKSRIRRKGHGKRGQKEYRGPELCFVYSKSPDCRGQHRKK